MASKASTSSMFLPSHRTSFPRKRKRMVRPVKDPDKWAPPHDGFTVVGVVHLFNEIAAIEEALMSAIENIPPDKKDNTALINRISNVSSLVSALKWADIPSMYGTLQDYKDVLEDANHSITESKAVMRTDSRDLEDSLVSFESMFKATSAPSNVLESVPSASQGTSLHMFQNARGVVISGGQFNIQHQPYNDNREQSDKILQRLNGLIAIVLF